MLNIWRRPVARFCDPGHSRRLALALVLVTLAAACAPSSRSQPASVPLASGGQSLAVGQFSLPAAMDFGDPGFHAVVTATVRMPQTLQAPNGRLLVLTLKDAGRPTQTCATDHPLSGCATVDWSDSPDRPHVPPSGVFINTVTLQLSSGPATLYLSQSGALASTPDVFQPG